MEKPFSLASPPGKNLSTLVDDILKIKKELTVVFQGERGAYSEEAAISHFGNDIISSPAKTITRVFETVEKNQAEYGIVPIENSTEGTVNETYDRLLDSKLEIQGEINLRISHCLISNPQANQEDITEIYSHPQALAQCRTFIERFGYQIIPTLDTAGSVRMIKEKLLLNAAAIASRRSSWIYGMKILAEGIEDTPNNYTRFLALSHIDHVPTWQDKTSIIFSTKHIAGSLYNVLGEFAVRDINLTMIVSRPTKQTPWEYNFYVDFEGHRSEMKVDECLKNLHHKTIFLKVLGSYPKANVEKSY